MEKTLVLISGAVVFKEERGKPLWFITQQGENDDWEIAKAPVRRGESSVRAVIRMMGEKGGMSTRVLEEVGRAGGVTTVKEKTLPQRYIYYLMILKSSSNETIGFQYYDWLDHSKALKRLSSKREKSMLKEAYRIYKNWKKQKEGKKKT